MSFKEMVAADIHNVFLNPSEFAEIRTIEYDGERYEDIPITLSGPTEADRQQRADDHAEGLYRVSAVLHCAVSNLNGNQPKKGQRIRINEEEGGGGYFMEYYVVSSVCRMGMLRVGLGAIRENERYY